MIQIVAALFGAVALGGLSMAGMRYADVPQPPVRLALVPSLLVAGGLIMLAYAAFAVGVPIMASCALGLFVLAGAAGAAINQFFQQPQGLLPLVLRMLPTLLAVTGFVLLLHSVFTNTPGVMR